MPHAITIGAALVFLWIVEAAMVAVNAAELAPDVAVIATVYAATYRDTFGALLAALVVGTIAAGSSSGGRGVELLALLPVIAATRAVARFEPLARPLTAFAWTAVSAILAGVASVLLGALLLQEVGLGSTLLRVGPAAALLTAALSVPVYAVFGAVDPARRAQHERASLRAAR